MICWGFPSGFFSPPTSPDSLNFSVDFFHSISFLKLPSLTLTLGGGRGIGPGIGGKLPHLLRFHSLRVQYLARNFEHGFFGNLTYNKQPMLLFFVKTTTFTEKESLCTCFLSHIAALPHIVGLWMTGCARCSTHDTSVTLSLVATCWSAHHQLPASSLVASLSTQQSALHQLSSARQSRPKNQHEAQLGRTHPVPEHGTYQLPVVQGIWLPKNQEG